MAEFNSIDDFLGHSGGGGGARGRYLKNWKKTGSIRIWLHTRRFPVAVWGHRIPQLVVFDDKQTGESVKAFYTKDLTCWEDESFLKTQYRRDENGELENGGPKRCALCRLTDYVHRAIDSGELSWTQELFRFEGATEKKNDRIIHAGGLTGLFNSTKLTPSDKAELREAGIRQTEAWAENFHARLQYAFVVVDHDDPGAGVQIAPQTSTIGDKVKSVIRDAQASLGTEEGNPMLNPFCIELTYDANAQMDKKYHARRVERYKLTEDIARLIRSEPPSLGGMTRPFNQKLLRGFLEKYAVVDLPWDDIFDVPVLEAGRDDEEEETTRESEPKQRRAPEVSTRAKREPESPPPAESSAGDVEIVPCDACGYKMRADEEKCRGCGAVYELEADDGEPEPPPPPKKGETKGDKLPFSGGKKGRF